MNRNVCCLLSWLVVATSLAAIPVRNGAVEAELISAVTSIQPGQPFTVALRMQHDPHWHTYWKNAGTGYPTSLVWTLPPGFSAGEIQWPVPQVYADAAGKVTGHGYDGENFLLVRITPPADLAVGPTVTLRAHAEWLMCKEVCMPGNADVTLTLAVQGGPPVTDETWAKKIAAVAQRLPVGLPSGWSATATWSSEIVELRLVLAGGTRPGAASLRFLSDDGYIDYEADQSIKMDRDGYRFRLKAASPKDPAPKRLTGIIRAEQGWTGGATNEWKPDGTSVGVVVSAGLLVDVPLPP